MEKKLKRAKRSKPIIIEIKDYRFEITCPHCKTHLMGGFSANTLRFKCYHCSNPIMVDWP